MPFQNRTAKRVLPQPVEPLPPLPKQPGKDEAPAVHSANKVKRIEQRQQVGARSGGHGKLASWRLMCDGEVSSLRGSADPVNDSKGLPQGLKRLRKKGFRWVRICQGLKPDVVNAAFTARVNSCPDTNRLRQGAFPQPVEPSFVLGQLRPD